MRKPDEAVYTALKKLNDKGYEAYLVGGAVRDFLLGKINSDYDITTNASPEAVRMVFDEYKKIAPSAKRFRCAFDEIPADRCRAGRFHQTAF